MVAKPLHGPVGVAAPLSDVELLARAQAHLPKITAAVAQIDRERRIPATVLDGLLADGLYRLLLPRAYGGHETDPLTFMRILEAVAGAEAGTAWNMGQNNVCGTSAAYMPPATAREIFGDPRAILAWGPQFGAPPKALLVEGGFRVTGTWNFASGMRHATWLGGLATVCEPDGTPRVGANGKPEQRTMLFPAQDVVITDVWDVIGLRGTASDAFAATDVFVPSARTTNRDDPADRTESGPLYRFGTASLFAPGFACVALGIARAMLEGFKALALEKTPRGLPSPLRDNHETQSDIGQAEGKLRSARALLFQTMEEAWDSSVTRGAIQSLTVPGLTMEQRIGIRLAASHAILSARQVADLAYEAAGATAIFGANPFEKRFRDMHTLVQQVQGRKAHFQSIGRFLLGMEPDNPFL